MIISLNQIWVKKETSTQNRALFLIKWTLLAIDSDHLSTVKDLGITEFWVDDTGKHPYFWLEKNLLFSCPAKARKREIKIPVKHNINNNKNTCEMRNCLQHSSESSTGGRLAPLLKAPSLLKGQYLECEGMTGFGRSRNDYAHISGGSVTNLIVWATSPVAPQMLQTNLRRTGQVTIFPSRVFKLWELKQKYLLLHFKVASNQYLVKPCSYLSHL